MKDITTLLSKGNLTPKERILLWVANQVSEERDGKKILTDADKHALVEGWRPKDNNEVKEYNRFNDGWEAAIFAGIDAQTACMKAEIGLLRSSRLVDYVLFTYGEELLNLSKRVFEGVMDVNQDDALDVVLNNSGLEFDDIVYRSAFASTSKPLRQDILALCPDAETENQYLDQEEVIADLLNGADTLTKDAKEKLADTIVDAMANKHADYFRAKGLSGEDWWFDGHYGDIPTIEIMKKWAEYNGINYEVDDHAVKALTKKIKEHAEKSGVGIGELLRQTILKWLDNGLLTDEYVPMCISKGKSTCNDIDTKLPHKEVFVAWLATKAKTKVLLQELIDKGEIKTEQKQKEFLGESRTIHLITSKSLYEFKGDLACAKDFQKQVDDIKPFGCLMVFLQGQGFLQNYASLLGFNEIFERLSKTYETDVGYAIRNLIRSFQENIKQLNTELQYIGERLDEAIYLKHDITFHMKIFIEGMLIDLAAIKPDMGGIVRKYHDKFQEVLGGEF